MRFADLKKGKIYYRKLRDSKANVTNTYKMLIVDKNEEMREIQAAIIPESGKPTAPQWYNESSFSRWKTKP